MDVVHIATILPNASPKRLKRIVESIPTPTSQSNFTEEEAIALMLELGLSRNKYQILRKALHEKGHNILPSYKAIQEKNKLSYHHLLLLMMWKLVLIYHKIMQFTEVNLFHFFYKVTQIVKYFTKSCNLLNIIKFSYKFKKK